MTVQGLAPVPKTGFSGAAAIDPQAASPAVVKLNVPDVAGIIDSAAQQATLIPGMRSAPFSARRRIAPGNGTAAMDQSIVRVICIRK